MYYCHYSIADGEDYAANPISLTFDENVSRNCFDVTILDDDRYELREDFFMNLTTTDPRTDIMPPTTIMMILDDDSEEKQ